MCQWFIAIILITCLYFYYSIKKKYNFFKKLGVPYLPPTFIFGNMAPLFFRQKAICDFANDLYTYNSDAKYIGIYDFLDPTFFIRDPELIKTIAIKNFTSFADHKAFADETVDTMLGKNIFNVKYEKWRDIRFVLTPTFSSNKLKCMFELMMNCSRNFIDYLIIQTNNEPNIIIDSKDLFMKFMNDMTANVVFGISVDTFANPKNDFYVFGSKAARMDATFSIKFLLYRAFPRLMKFLNVKFLSDDQAAFFTNVIKNNVKVRDKHRINRPDMLQLLMEAREYSNVKLDTNDIATHAFSFYIGGVDKTSTQMCLMAHVLVIYSDIQKKLQDEIDQVLRETKGQVTYQDIIAMPYLDAVFNETMRKHSQTFTLERLCRKEFELPPALPGGKPVIVKPGTSIWFPVTGIHHDPKYFQNPEKFDPDRYYNKQALKTDLEDLGFGIGPRCCIGKNFAILETKILFFYLLSKFDLKSSDKTCKTFEYCKRSFSIAPKEGFYLRIVPRKNTCKR